MTHTQIIIALFAILYVILIIYTRRKGDFEEFSVAGRSLGVFLIFSSLCASFIGPGMSLGFSREGLTNGFLLTFVAFWGCLGLVFIGFFLAPEVRTKFAKSFSVGDIIGGPESHNHKLVRITVGIVSVLFAAASVTATGYAGGELVNNIFGFSKFWSIAVLTIIVIIYSSFGGIRATIQTDAVQFVHFAILIPLLALFMVQDKQFSWSEFIPQAVTRTADAFDSVPLGAIVGMMFFWLLALAGPHAAVLSRFLAARDAGVAKRATAYAGLFLVFWLFVMVFIGSAGAYLHPDLLNNDQVLLEIGALHFPGILNGIFIIALIGVVISTQDTGLNTASVIFSEDIIAGINPDISDSGKLYYSKLITIIIGFIAIVIGGFLDSIMTAVITIYSYYIPVMIPVAFFAIIKRQHYWQSAMAAMIFGFFFHFTWELIGIESFPSLLIGVVGSCVAYLCSDVIVKNRGKKFFRQ